MSSRSARREAVPQRGPDLVWKIVLVAFSIAGLGPVCDPGAIRVTNRPPDPVLVDTHGDVDSSGVDALIAAIEKDRELRFIQRPTLELLAADDPALPSLEAAARALDACPRSDAAGEHATVLPGACFPDPSLEWISCVDPPDLEQARQALRRLLDAQHYPRLARIAPTLRGDPGVAVRSLLAASAQGAPQRVRHPGDPDPLEIFDLPTIELGREEEPQRGCVAIAEHFLMSQDDREAPFRRPPLSTMQLVSPRSYQAGERPVRLVGTAPSLRQCVVESDESVGVARLLIEALANGISLPGPLLGAWKGDRGIRFACEDGVRRWIYVAVLSDPAAAANFAAAIPRLLPAAFEGRLQAQAIGSRVVVISRGIEVQGAHAWAIALAPREIVDLQDLD